MIPTAALKTNRGNYLYITILVAECKTLKHDLIGMKSSFHSIILSPNVLITLLFLG